MTCQRHIAGSPSTPSAAAVDADAALAFGLDAQPRVMEAAESYTVTLSEEARDLLFILRKDGESDGRAVERALEGLDAYRIIEKALKSRELRKAFNVTRQLRRRGFGDETTTAMCRALFGAQSEKDLRSAFRLLDLDESGFIDKEELSRALPLLSEEVSEERLDELFSLVDVDSSGLIDFEEFCALVRGLNPKLDDQLTANPFQQFQADAQGGLEIVGEVLSSAAWGASSSVSAMSTAFSADLPGISPLEMRKAGTVLKNMRLAGYDDRKAQTICRALFCEQSEKHLQRAFRFFDADRSGFIEAVEFREALPLMGENVPDEQINELFRKVAVDESGNINFASFCKLVKAMNPKSKKKAAQEFSAISMLGDAADRVARTWAAKTRALQDHDEEPEHRKSNHRKTSGGGASVGSSAGSTGRASPAVIETARAAASGVALPPRAQRVSVQRYNPSDAF